MASMLVKDVPPQTHTRLKAQAKRNRRSLNQEVITLIEQGLEAPRRRKLPKPIKPRKPIDHEWLLKAMKEGRT